MKEDAKKEAPPAHPYLLIGETAPKTLTVIDADGKPHPLLSFKTATDALVVGFFSPRCSANQAQWHALERLYETYKGWHVSFVGVSVNPGETLAELSDAMAKAGVHYQAVRDEGGAAARLLHVTATPEILIFDEWGQLQYRGPVKSSPPGLGAFKPYADRALEVIIAHQGAVTDPEPGDSGGCALQ